MHECISRRVVGLTASLLTAAPASALACPVCALVGTSNNTWAYQAMSAMLTLPRLAARADRQHQSASQHFVNRAPVGETEPYSVAARAD
jgi:hypothetical protein